MYCISIQIRPKVAREFDREQLLERVRPIRSPEVDAYEEKGKLLLSFNFFTEYPAPLWQQLQTALRDGSAFSEMLFGNAIILCEDETSDACYLVHHYDATEPLDTLPEVKSE